MKSVVYFAFASILTISSTSFAQTPQVPSVQPIQAGILASGTPQSVYDAENLFWTTFQKQNYKGIPTLVDKLQTTAKFLEAQPASEGISEARALMYGRLGWTFIWSVSEFEHINQSIGQETGDIYTRLAPMLPAPKEFKSKRLIGEATAIQGIKRDISGLFQERDKSIIKSARKNLALQAYKSQSAALGATGTFYFGRAADLVMPFVNGEVTYAQKGWDSRKRLALATFPAVLAGFYGQVNTPPTVKPSHGHAPPFTIQETYKNVTHSLGFNFATPPIAVGYRNGQLGVSDMPTMWQMIQVGSRLQGVKVFGASASQQTSIYSRQTFKNFYDNNKAFQTFLPYIPAEINQSVVKASVASSDVVPFNYEVNFMLLGDSMVGTYANQPEQWKLVKNVVKDAYNQPHLKSPIYSQWPYKGMLAKRKTAINESAASLLKVVQQKPVAFCMSCHQSSSAK